MCVQSESPARASQRLAQVEWLQEELNRQREEYQELQDRLDLLETQAANLRADAAGARKERDSAVESRERQRRVTDTATRSVLNTVNGRVQESGVAEAKSLAPLTSFMCAAQQAPSQPALTRVLAAEKAEQRKRSQQQGAVLQREVAEQEDRSSRDYRRPGKAPRH
eukprot:SAG22_NODE_7683_length_717_cov_1.477346_2_plen_165_part_01